MNTKIMEGLSGAGTNRKLLATPMKVYHAASRKGDTGTMERAFGYASDFAGKAKEYQEKTRKGMEEEAKEVREKKKLEQEKAIEQRRLERQEEQNALISDTSGGQDISGLENGVGSDGEAEAGKEKPMIYTNIGEKQTAEQKPTLSVRV